MYISNIFLLNFITLASCISYPMNLTKKYEIRTPVIIGNYDLDFIFNFTRYLDRLHNFRTFIVFSENREYNRAKHIIVRPLEQALMEEFDTPLVVWGSNSMVQLRYLIGLNILIFVYISSANDPILEVVSYNLRGLHYMPIIFIYKRRGNIPPTLQEIRVFFEWCWQENMLNVVLTYQVMETKWSYVSDSMILDIKNEVFNYTPFPELVIFNVTEQVYKNEGNFIKDNIKDVHLYQFRTPMFMDTPSVFLVRKIIFFQEKFFKPLKRKFP